MHGQDMGTGTGTGMDMGTGNSVSTNCFAACCAARLAGAQMHSQSNKHASIWSRVCHMPQSIVTSVI